MPLVVCTRMTACGGSALDGLRDGCCTDRQRRLVLHEGEVMGENILPDLGIQQALTGNQGIHRPEEYSCTAACGHWCILYPAHIGLIEIDCPEKQGYTNRL